MGQLKNMLALPRATSDVMKSAVKRAMNIERNGSVTRKLTPRTDKIYLSIIFTPLRIND